MDMFFVMRLVDILLRGERDAAEGKWKVTSQDLLSGETKSGEFTDYELACLQWLAIHGESHAAMGEAAENMATNAYLAVEPLVKDWGKARPIP